MLKYAPPSIFGVKIKKRQKKFKKKCSEKAIDHYRYIFNVFKKKNFCLRRKF